MKKLIQLILTVSLFTGTLVHAAPGRSPEQMMGLFEEYLSHVKSRQQGPVWLEYGRQKHLARAVIAQITAMQPDQFNALLFLLMERYVAKPEERTYIFNFLSATTETISADLEYSRSLQDGPAALMLDGAWKYGAWVLIAGHIGYGVMVRKNIMGVADIAKHFRQRQVAIGNYNKYLGIGYGVATSPTTLIAIGSTGIGVAGGYFEHMIGSSGTHRFNPMIATMVVQANLGCHLSYLGIAAQDDYEKVKDDNDKLKAAKKDLLTRIASVSEQAKVLNDQFSRLENLDVRDRLFQKVLEQYPKAEGWTKFRELLTNAETSSNGQCRQMSMRSLRAELEKTAVEINALVPDDVPAAPAPEMPTKDTPLP